MSESVTKQVSPAGRIELAICLAATLVGAGLQVVYFAHAGALWRDEAGGVQLATLPAFSETWRMLAHDGFPVFFPALIRAWSALGLGASDVSLRILGLVIGFGMLGAMWLNGRIMGFRRPFVCLGLLAANATFVTYGDSLRAYGCGSLFILITLGLVWKLLRQPGRATFLLAALAAILSVQTLFQNAFLVLAICCAGLAVCARQRQWKTAGLVLGVGLAAGVSLMPYLPLIIESQSWWLLQKVGFDFARVWERMTLAIGCLMDWTIWVWVGLVLITLGAGLAALREPAQKTGIGRQDLPLYGAAALAAGIAGFLIFIRISQLPTELWYYLPLMVFAAAAMDGALANWFRRFQFWLAAFVVLMIFLLFPTALQFAGYRQTNVDLIAAELQQRAKPGDFIVVFTCHCGVTFNRYYKGQIPWTTFPELSDHRFHRFDLLKEKEAAPSKPELERAAQTLKSGHTLWLVIESPFESPGNTEPPGPPPAPWPDIPLGWQVGPYSQAWKEQLEYLVTAHAEQIEEISVKPEIPINLFEKLSFIRASGWRETAAAQPGLATPP